MNLSAFCWALPSLGVLSPDSPGSINQTGGSGRHRVITEDESVVFTPLLCNNKDGARRGTKGNDGLYTETPGGDRLPDRFTETGSRFSRRLE